MHISESTLFIDISTFHADPLDDLVTGQTCDPRVTDPLHALPTEIKGNPPGAKLEGEIN